MNSKFTIKEVTLLFTIIYCFVCAPNLYGSFNCPGINPCTAFCKYAVTTSNSLSAQCSSGQTVNGGCTACDSLLFTLEPGGFCIPHLFNS